MRDNISGKVLTTKYKYKMKKIEAIIRRTRFDDVKQALLDADIEWFSYYDVRGVGKTAKAAFTAAWCTTQAR